MDSFELQEYIQYEGSINNPIIIDDDSDDESDQLPPPPEAPQLTTYDFEEDSEDEILVADDYELPFMKDNVEEMDHSNLDSQFHESDTTPIPSDDDGSSIAESELCTTDPDPDHYNRVCFLHRGYFPRRGTNTNGSIWDHPTGIILHFKEWKEGQLSLHLSVLQKNNKVRNLRLILAIPPCPKSIRGIRILSNLRDWDRLDIVADASWMDFCYLFPRMNNINIKIVSQPSLMDKTHE
uniref:RanBD1 domain-containing protein n=1 Tax=Strongyloides papillosus TaxID=174720 RepID=A0A0N5B2T9_STREA